MSLFSSCVTCTNPLSEIESSGLRVEHSGKNMDRLLGLAFLLKWKKSYNMVNDLEVLWSGLLDFSRKSTIARQS